MTTLISGGQIVDPVRGVIESRDILIDRGKISRILPRGGLKETGPQLDIMNIQGKIVVPGK